MLDEYLRNKKPAAAPPRPVLTRGDLAPSSIFEGERAEQRQRQLAKATSSDLDPLSKQPRDPAVMAAVLDPRPEKRRRWERLKIMQTIRKGPKLTKVQRLKRTERESLSKSHWMKTSVKKLVMLARQIAGRPVEEALVQMRFSKKKVAREVYDHLEHARNEAIVRRGMGLGEVKGTSGEPVQIETKEGKRKTILDRTGMYIDQAWVNRGPFGSEPEHRAKGRVNILRPPYTSELAQDHSFETR